MIYIMFAQVQIADIKNRLAAVEHFKKYAGVSKVVTYFDPVYDMAMRLEAKTEGDLVTLMNKISRDQFVSKFKQIGKTDEVNN